MVTDSPGPAAIQDAERLDFVLPGSWWCFPLGEQQEASEASINGFVTRLLGRHDSLAPVRHQVKDELRSVVTEAREAGAHQLHLAIELAEGVPLPATLVIMWPRLPVRLTGPIPLRLQVLEASLDDPELERLEHPSYGVLKSVRSVSRVVEDDDGRAELKRLEARYWITLPDERQVVCFAFTSLLPGLHDELVALFDAVIATLQ